MDAAQSNGTPNVNFFPVDPTLPPSQYLTLPPMFPIGIYQPGSGHAIQSDIGATWKFMDGGRKQVRLWQRGWYFGGITADPNNADIVYVMDTATYRSTDGGASI